MQRATAQRLTRAMRCSLKGVRSAACSPGTAVRYLTQGQGLQHAMLAPQRQGPCHAPCAAMGHDTRGTDGPGAHHKHDSHLAGVGRGEDGDDGKHLRRVLQRAAAKQRPVGLPPHGPQPALYGCGAHQRQCHSRPDDHRRQAQVAAPCCGRQVPAQEPLPSHAMGMPSEGPALSTATCTRARCLSGFWRGATAASAPARRQPGTSFEMRTGAIRGARRRPAS